MKPTVDEILAKYEAALGRQGKDNQDHCAEIKASRVEPDGKNTEPEEIFQKGKKIVANTIYGKYVVSEMFDGKEFWKFGDN